MSILVIAGSRVIDQCDQHGVLRYLSAPNAKVIRRKRTGEVVRVELFPRGDDSRLRSVGDDHTPTYEEHLEVHHVTVLKRLDPGTGQLVRWSPEDSFAPGRFNPDRLPVARVKERVVGLRRTDDRPARPADAPTVPPARFCVKRNQSLPWSEANSIPVF